MQHLQLVISALLLAGGVFQVDGSPGILEEQDRVFAEATPETLSTVLNFKQDVDISDTFAHILVGLSKSPQDGGIYFRMAQIFLQELKVKKIAPDFVKAWTALCYIMNDGRLRQVVSSTIDVPRMIARGLEKVYKTGVDEQLKTTFDGLTELISDAMHGDLQKAKQIVAPLAEVLRDFADFYRVNEDVRTSVLEMTSRRLQWWATGLRRVNEFAEQKV